MKPAWWKLAVAIPSGYSLIPERVSNVNLHLYNRCHPLGTSLFPVFREWRCFVPSSNFVFLLIRGNVERIEKGCWWENIIEENHWVVPFRSTDGVNGKKGPQLNHTGYTNLHHMANPLLSRAAIHEADSMEINLPRMDLDKLFEFAQYMLPTRRTWKLKKTSLELNFMYGVDMRNRWDRALVVTGYWSAKEFFRTSKSCLQ